MLPLELQFIITFISALLLGTMFTWIIRKVMMKFRILDVPDQERKIHGQPVPLGGGVALYLSVSATMVILFIFGWLADERVSSTTLITLFIGGAILVVGGLFDDRKRLSWWQQMLFPVIAVILMIAAGLEISYVTNPFGGGFLHLDSFTYTFSVFTNRSWVFMPIADIFLFVWVLGMIYTTKLLDGVDGLVSSVSGVAALVLFIVSLSWDRSGSTTSFIALALAGSAAGFLIWNWHPARIFLGEGGSTYFGFMLAILAVISGGKIATALLVMGLPILDVIWIIYRRLRTGSKLYVGDEKHLHFRLLHAGLTQKQVVVFYSFLALLFGSVSFYFTTKGKIIALVFLIIVMILLARFILTRHEKKALPR